MNTCKDCKHFEVTKCDLNTPVCEGRCMLVRHADENRYSTSYACRSYEERVR